VIERLAAAGFQLLPAFQIATHYVLEREGFVALVERLPDGGFGAAGAPGLLGENGIAYLVWRGEAAVFVSKGREVPAGPEQIEALRRFDRDLRAALGR
jgi:hypothetical protein